VNIYAIELNNEIKDVPKRKQYIESLIVKAEKPDIIVLPELALCSYIGNIDVWQYADKNSADSSRWAMDIAAT
jgi:predicted amidohydrolase